MKTPPIYEEKDLLGRLAGIGIAVTAIASAILVVVDILYWWTR